MGVGEVGVGEQVPNLSFVLNTVQKVSVLCLLSIGASIRWHSLIFKLTVGCFFHQFCKLDR